MYFLDSQKGGGAILKIAVASDHAGFELKEELKEFLGEQGHEVFDFGTNGLDSVDYPDFAQKAAGAVSLGRFDKAVLICGSGIGMAMAANKVTGVRAANCNDLKCALLSRQHNDANVLTLGSRLVDLETAKEIVLVWLGTEFEGGRHLTRISKMAEIESAKK